MVLKDILDDAFSKLKAVSQSPRLDAELLLSKVTGLTRTGLITHAYDEVSSDNFAHFTRLLERRLKSEPMAYLTGAREFYGVDMEVSPHVLVPRPETELLIEMSLEFLNGFDRRVEVLDLGTGSGCIAVVLALELLKRRKPFHITALDADPNALGMAEVNAKRQGIEQHVTFLQSDWFSALRADGASFDIIVSNPPYVSEEEMNLPGELAYEPRSALFSASGGLEDIEHLIKESPKFLRRPGYFICEMGYDQRRGVEEIVSNLVLPEHDSCNVTFFKDLAGRDRAFCLEVLSPL